MKVQAVIFLSSRVWYKTYLHFWEIRLFPLSIFQGYQQSSHCMYLNNQYHKCMCQNNRIMLKAPSQVKWDVLSIPHSREELYHFFPKGQMDRLKKWIIGNKEVRLIVTGNENTMLLQRPPMVCDYRWLSGEDVWCWIWQPRGQAVTAPCPGPTSSKAENQLLGSRCTHQALTLLATSITQTDTQYAQNFSPTTLPVQTITQGWLEHPGPPISSPTSVSPVETHRHIYTSHPWPYSLSSTWPGLPDGPSSLAPPGSWRYKNMLQLSPYSPTYQLLQLHLRQQPHGPSHTYACSSTTTDKHMVPNTISEINIWFYALHEMSPVATMQASSPGYKPNC